MVPAEKVVTCAPSDTVETAVEKLLGNRVSSIIVLDEKAPVGIMTKTDLVKAYKDKVAFDAKVETIMTQGLETVDENTPKDVAADVIQSKKIHHVVVVNGKGEFAGIVSSLDIAREGALDAKAWPWNRWESKKSLPEAPEAPIDPAEEETPKRKFRLFGRNKN
jgi:predicted transcriptional regulator